MNPLKNVSGDEEKQQQAELRAKLLEMLGRQRSGPLCQRRIFCLPTTLENIC